MYCVWCACSVDAVEITYFCRYSASELCMELFNMHRSARKLSCFRAWQQPIQKYGNANNFETPADRNKNSS